MKNAIFFQIGILAILSCITFKIPTENNFFINLKNELKNHGGYNINNKDKAIAFYKDITNISKESLLSQILLYLNSSDIVGYYWCANYLSSDYYLDGKKPEYEIALLILLEGSSHILQQPQTKENNMLLNSISIKTAILSKKMGLESIAYINKERAENLMRNDSSYKYSFPALYKIELDIYDSIIIKKE